MPIITILVFLLLRTKYILLSSPTSSEVCEINCSVSLTIREMQTKTAVAHPTLKGYHKKKPKITSVAKAAEKRELLHATAESANY